MTPEELIKKAKAICISTAALNAEDTDTVLQIALALTAVQPVQAEDIDRLETKIKTLAKSNAKANKLADDISALQDRQDELGRAVDLLGNEQNKTGPAVEQLVKWYHELRSDVAILYDKDTK